MMMATILLAMLASAPQASAQTSWIGNRSTNWFDAGNWTAGVPTAQLDATVGDASFIGPFQPAVVTAPAYCRTLVVGAGSAASSLLLKHHLYVYGDLTIGTRGAVTQDAARTITVKGHWSNAGLYTALNSSATVYFAGKGRQNLTGGTTFQRLNLSSGSVVVLGANIAVNGLLTLSGTLDPSESPTWRVEGSGKLVVNSTGVLMVRASTFEENYALTNVITLGGNSTVDYAATTGGQLVSSRFVYSTLKVSGGGRKYLAANLPPLLASNSSYGRLTLAGGTLDLGEWKADRGTNVVGGRLSISAGAHLRLTGTSNFPGNFKTPSVNLVSTVEYAGANQVVQAMTYGNLILSGNQAVVAKTMTPAPLVVSSDLRLEVGDASLLAFTASAPVTIKGSLLMGPGTVFEGGSGTATITKGWDNQGTFNGGTGTVVIAGANARLSGAGIYRLNHLTLTAAGVAAAAETTLTINGMLRTSGSGAFTHLPGGNGAVILAGDASGLTGRSIVLNHLQIPGTATTTSSFVVNGDLEVGGSFSATAGTITLAGTNRTVTGLGFLGFYALRVTGSLSAEVDLLLRSSLAVTGSFIATRGTTTFAGSTTFTGSAQLHDTVLNGSLLRLGAGSVLRLTGLATLVTGVFDATALSPNTVAYQGGDGQPVFPIGYHHLEIGGSGTKRCMGSTFVRGNLTILPGAKLDAGAAGNTLKVQGVWSNYGRFEAGDATVEFYGTGDSVLEGAGCFGTLRVAKDTAAGALQLHSDITVTNLDLLLGIVATSTNVLTLAGNRTGEGTVLGTLTRRHEFLPGVEYAFESPLTSIKFESLTTVTAVTVTSTLEPPPPPAIPFAGSASRYQAIVVEGTGPYDATLRLRFRDAELGGAQSEDLQLWHGSPGWAGEGSSRRDLVASWVERSGITGLDGTWVLSDEQNIVAWTGSESTEWTRAANWTVVQGAPSLPPSEHDSVHLGGRPVVYQPAITTPVTVRSITFDSVTAVDLALASGGSLTVLGPVEGEWTRAAAHTIAVGNHEMRVGGHLRLSDGTMGNAIDVSLGTGVLNVTNRLEIDGGARLTVTGTGRVNVGGDFVLRNGAFAGGTGTVNLMGTDSQSATGNLTFHHLAISKPSGTARLTTSMALTGDLTVAGPSVVVLDAPLAVAGSVTLGAEATLRPGTSTVSVGGDWSGPGSFVPDASKVVFNGADLQTVAAAAFNDLVIDKPAGVARLAGDVVIRHDLEIARGALELGSFAADREETGGSLLIGADGTLRIGAHFPANFAARSLHPESTTEYQGTTAQEVAAEAYGNLVLRQGGNQAKTLAGDISVQADLTIDSGASLAANAFTLTLQGDWTNRGAFLPEGGTVVLAGREGSLAGNTTFGNLIVTGGYAVADNDLDIQGDVFVSGSLDAGAGAIRVSGDLVNSGVLMTRGTTTLTGTREQTIRLLNPIQATAQSVINFNGTVAPVLDSTAAPQFVHLNINNTGGVIPSVGWTVFGTFTVGHGAAFRAGEETHVFYGSVTNRGSLSSSGAFVFRAPVDRTLDLGNDFASTGLVSFEGTGAIRLAGGALSFGSVTLANTAPAGLAAVSPWTIKGDFTIQRNATFHAGTGIAHTLSGDLLNEGTFDGGTAALTLPDTTIVSGSGYTVFHTLTIAPGGSATVINDLGFIGSLTNHGVFQAPGARVRFDGPEAALIGGTSASLAFSTLTVAKPGAVLTLATDADVAAALQVDAGTLNLGSARIGGAGSAILSIGSGAGLKLGGTNSLPSFGTYAFDPASTVEYAGAGTQTIAPRTYGHLRSSGSGTRVLAPGGVIRVLGAFTAGNNTYFTAGSTVDYGGVGSQTIAALGYHHLSSSSSGTRVLASGTTISVAGTFTPGANSYTTTGSTVLFNGGAQTVPVFGYHHLATAGSGTKMLAGSFSVGGNLTLGPGVLDDAGATLTVQGDALIYGSHAGAGRIRFRDGAVPHRLSGSGAYNHLELDDPLGASLVGNNLVVRNTLTLSAGLLSTDTNKVIAAPGATVQRVSGHVDGSLQQRVAVGGQVQVFDVGDTNAYAPVVLAFDAVTTAGDVTATARPGEHPDFQGSGLDAGRALNRYWSVTNAGSLFGSCTVTLHYPAGETDPAAVPSYFIAALREGTWTRLTATEVTATNATIAGLHAFGDFTLGEPAPGDGVWTGAAGGSWGTTTNWLDGRIATGTGRGADFTSLTLARNTVVTLEKPRTLGGLHFADAGRSYDWKLTSPSGAWLTLATPATPPSVMVGNRAATIDVSLAGWQGLVAEGPGTLVLAGDNTYSGQTTVASGGRLGVAHSHALGSATGLTVVESGGTLNLAASGLALDEPIQITDDGPGGEGALNTGVALDARLNGHIDVGPAGARLVIGSPAAVLTIGGDGELAQDLTLVGPVGGAGTVEFQGRLSGPGGLRSIPEAGSGTRLVLHRGNTLRGDTTIEAGGLALRDRDALQFSTLDWAVNAALDAGGLSQVVLGGLKGDGRLTLPAGLTLTVGNNGKSTAFSGVLQGQDSVLAKVGGGSLTLSGVNTFSGGVLIKDGPANAGVGVPGQAAIVMAGPQALGEGPVSIGGEVEYLRALEFASADHLTVRNPLNLPPSGATQISIQGRDADADFELAGRIRGGHLGLTLNFDSGAIPGGSVRLSNPANDFTATLCVRRGRLELTNDGALGNAGNRLILDQNSSEGASLWFAASGINVTHSIEMGGDTVFDLAGREVVISGDMTSRLPAGVGYLEGGQARAGASEGSLKLAGHSTFAAPLVIRSSHTKLIVASPTALGSPTGGTTIVPAADHSSIALAGVGAYIHAEPLTIHGEGCFERGAGVGALENLSGDNAFDGPITLAGDSAIGVTAGTLTLGGVISGDGVLTKVGPGALKLTGSRSGTGLTVVTGGLLSLGDSGNTGQLSGDIENHADLVFDRSDDLAFPQRISGAGAVTKRGSGTLTLAGLNSYTGTTTVAQGTLALGAVDGGPVIAAGTLTVGPEAAVVWSNHSQLDRAVQVVMDGGVLRPNGWSNALGTLKLTRESRIEFRPGAPSRLEFQASDRLGWTVNRSCSSCHDGGQPLNDPASFNHHTLVLTNWSSADVVRFGSNSAGLGTGGPEFAQVRFVNFDNSGLTTNGYLRPDGVLVPATRVQHAVALSIQAPPPAEAVAGVPFVQPVRIALVDEFGAVDTADNETWIWVGGPFPVTGTRFRQVTNGVAAFDDLACSRAGTNRLTFSSGVVPPAVSGPILVRPGPATGLVFLAQPAREVAGLDFQTVPVVMSIDAFSNLTRELGGSVPVTLALVAGDGPLSGAVVQDIGTNAGQGIVSFAPVQIGSPGTDKQLQATAPGLTAAISGAFSVVSPNQPPGFTGWQALALETIKSFGAPATEGMYLQGGVIPGSDQRLYGVAYNGGERGAGTVFRVGADGSEYEVLHAFGGDDGANPTASMVEGPDGRLYGTTYNGGAHDAGCVFTLNRDGTGFSLLHHFGGPGDAAHPAASLVFLADGFLCGTAERGGAHAGGAVFKLRPEGGGYELLHSFGTGVDGSRPKSAVVQDGAGGVYGTTELGGATGAGTVYRLNSDGSGYAVVHAFSGGTDGAYPRGGVILAGDGVLYGTTMEGGEGGRGTVFSMRPDGTGKQALHDFQVSDGAEPWAALTLAPDGRLVGTAYYGGERNLGVVFRLGTNGTDFIVLHSFAEENEGAQLTAPLSLGSGGTLYGTAYYGGSGGIGSVFALRSDGTGFRIVRHLQAPDSDEAWSPQASLVEGPRGVFQGTTYLGGKGGAGTVFRVEGAGSGYEVLHDFMPADFTGGTPNAELVSGQDGTLYGTTIAGGTRGASTVFRISRDGSDHRLLRSSGDADGRLYAALIQDAGGVLYGTSDAGGSYRAGCVFALDSDGNEYRVLHSFGEDLTEGINPGAALLLGRDGRLYGTTAYGGRENAGVVFSLGVDGGGYRVLHTFGTMRDGRSPNAGLIQDAQGHLYGSTAVGGSANAGALFALNPDGSGYTVLHEFAGGADGATPQGRLLLADDGRLYGCTYYGGGFDRGMLYRLQPDGDRYQVVHRFGSSTRDGADPFAGVVQGADGLLYGTTEGGGEYAQGTVFRMRPLMALVIDPWNTLEVTVAAQDPDAPEQTLTFGLLAGPDGMQLDAATGQLSWTPNPDQGPGAYPVTITVSDDGWPVLVATNTLMVEVRSGVSATTLALHSYPATTQFGETVTATAAVTTVHDGRPSGGLVVFKDGSNVLGSAGVQNGEATIELSGLATGVHGLSAEYAGSASLLGSTGTVTHVVTRAEQAALTFAPASPQVFGTTNLLDAAGGSGTGALTYAVVGGPGVVVGGNRLVLTSGTGVVTVRATRSGDANHLPRELAVQVAVARAPSSLLLSSSADPSHAGQWVAFTATATGGGDTPGGTVTLLEGAAVLGTATLDVAGSAAFTTRSLAVGEHDITAVYTGDHRFAGSQRTVTQVVAKQAAQVRLVSAPNPSAAGEPAALVATVAAGLTRPTGTVIFSRPGLVLGTAPLDVNGEAILVTTFAAPGSYELTATYGGDEVLQPAQGSVSHAVFEVSPAIGPLAGGNQVTLTFDALLETGATVAGVQVGPGAARIEAQGTNWVRFSPGSGPGEGPVDLVVHSTAGGLLVLTNAYAYKPRGYILDNTDPANPGLSPSRTLTVGGELIRITGRDLGNGADITEVALCGVAATIVDQSRTHVTVIAGPAPWRIRGEVRVFSVSSGETVLADAFAYVGEEQEIDFTPLDDQVGLAPVELTATTSSGLPVTFRVSEGPGILVNGWRLVPTGVGRIGVVASQPGNRFKDPAPSVTNWLDVLPVPATVLVSGLTQIYDGTPRGVDVRTDPPGLFVTVTYDGQVHPPVQPGDYAVLASVALDSFQASVRGTLTVTKATAQIGVGGLNRAYNGSPQPVDITTTPAGLVATVTYDGMDTAPAAPGSYTVWAVINDPRYHGGATATLTIDRGPQTISFDPITDQPADAAMVTVVTRASSGLPVALAVQEGPAELAGADTLRILGSGRVTVTASQSGSPLWHPAARISRSFVVNSRPVPGSVTISRELRSGAKVRISTLLGTDPDGDRLRLLATDQRSAAGGNIRLSGNWVFYTPAVGWTNLDTFGFSVGDAQQEVAGGTVTVTAGRANLGPTANYSVETLGDGALRLHFSGVPGRTYAVQWSHAGGPPDWQPISTVTADSNGDFMLTDAPASDRVYRTTNLVP